MNILHGLFNVDIQFTTILYMFFLLKNIVMMGTNNLDNK